MADLAMKNMQEEYLIIISENYNSFIYYIM